MNKNVKLQNILLPLTESDQKYFKMYYAEDDHKVDVENKCVRLAKGEVLDCSAYFNSISYGKWMEYTNLKEISLHLDIKGDFTLSLMVYGALGQHKDLDKLKEPEEYLYSYKYVNKDEDIPPFIGEVVFSKDYSMAERGEVTVVIPKNAGIIVGFKIVPHAETAFFGGHYDGVIDDADVRDVCLSLATTTFKKEDFIRPNVQLLKDKIINTDEEIAKNFYVHVVDNGRTLTPEEIEGDQVFLHPNPNVGGSGGFSRGMIESLRQKGKKPTHVLLMDDDVIVQPESIIRTYNLLKLVKDKYKDAFVSGAMLFYEKMQVQHEDVGFIDEFGAYGPKKSWLDHYFFNDVIRNEAVWKDRDYEYAGWWYCCIPTSIAREDNLPLPLFIRGDDVEYSLRNKAQFLTMNGICVWHMGFTQKFNAMMELYQVMRNSLAFQAFADVATDIDFAARIKRFFRTEILRFNYDSAELLLDALEDFMKGPEFYREPRGEEIMKKQSQKNEKLVDLSEFPGQKLYLDELYKDKEISHLKLFLYRLTWNGQFAPNFMLNKEPVMIPYDWFYAKGKQALHTNLLAVNPFTETAHMRTLDRKRGRALLRRSRKLFKHYKKHHIEIEKNYRDHFKEFTSVAFWEKYLGI